MLRIAWRSLKDADEVVYQLFSAMFHAACVTNFNKCEEVTTEWNWKDDVAERQFQCRHEIILIVYYCQVIIIINITTKHRIKQ